jgi:hypothetical protein
MVTDKIVDPLRALLREREIIARCELLLSTYDAVRAAKLTDQETLELKKMVGEKIAPGIFASIMSKTPVFDLPGLDTYTQMDGRIYHFLHTKKYSKQDFNDANRKFLLSLPELKNVLRQSLSDSLKGFMHDAGYGLTAESQSEITFSAPERSVKAFIVTSVKAIDVDKCKPEPGVDYVILVPSSETLEPFVQFFREKGGAVEEKGIQIWVTNLEKGTIDPFVGFTTDLDIYNQFDNPRLAEMVRNNWRKIE